MTYQLENVWPNPSEKVREEVLRFWQSEGAIPDLQLAKQRAHQLIVVARDGGGQVAGVSTGVATYVDRLGFDCIYYRTFVGQNHRVVGLRSTGLVWQILRASHKLLNERFQEGHDSQVRGLYMEIENASVMKSRNDLIWSEEGMNVVYIGRTPEGRHVRVWYFEGARS